MVAVVATENYRLLPGRLRIAVGGLRRNPSYAQYLIWRMGQLKGIKAVSANPLTGRALLRFTPELLNLADIQQELGKCRVGYGKAKASFPAAGFATGF